MGKTFKDSNYAMKYGNTKKTRSRRAKKLQSYDRKARDYETDK